MSEFIKKKSVVKLISILMAILAWYYITNAENPIVREEFNIPISIQNEVSVTNKRLILSKNNVPRNVTVSVRGRKQKIDALILNNFTASVDLSDVDLNNNEVNVSVYIDEEKIKDGITIENISPKIIDLDIEDMGQNAYKVDIETNGKIEKGYELHRVSTIPDIISLQGVSSFVDSVEVIKATIDINGLKEDQVFNIKCKFYDKNNNEIQNEDKEVYVEVKIEVVKEVAVVPTVIGKTDKNYMDTNRDITPNKVKIKGPYAVTKDITQIKTQPIDIEDLDSSISKIVTLSIPQGISLVDTSETANVTIGIEKIVDKEVEVNLEKSNISNKNENYTYNYTDEKLKKIKISGTESEISKLQENDIITSIDVRRIELGQHSVKLKIDVPTNIKVIEEYFVEIVVREIDI